MRRELPVVKAKGRGSHIDPPNRFGAAYRPHDPEQDGRDGDDGSPPAPARPADRVLPRPLCRTIVTENDSPDVGFRFSLNLNRSRRLAARASRPSHRRRPPADFPDRGRGPNVSIRAGRNYLRISGNGVCFEVMSTSNGSERE